MRAARLHALGGVPTIDEVDAPSGPDLIEVSSAALNPIDISIGNGLFYGGSPEMPYVIGSEVVGRTPDGRRVWVRGRGLMSDVVDPASRWVFDIPEGVSDDLALGCGISGLTAWLAVAWRAPVGPDDTVLVLGASGTLGSIAVQAAKALGAGRVIGAARRTAGVPVEADEVVDLGSDAALPAATVIIDGLWGEPFERAMAAAADGVRVVQLGQSASPNARVESAWIRGKAAAILGFALFLVEEDVARAGYTALCELARDGAIHVEVEHLGLNAIGDAWTKQAGGSPAAKLVLELNHC